MYHVHFLYRNFVSYMSLTTLKAYLLLSKSTYIRTSISVPESTFGAEHFIYVYVRREHRNGR